MTTEDATPIQLSAAVVGTIDLGPVEVPYVDLHEAPYVHQHVDVDGTQYSYDRSYPVQGGSAVMPAVVSELLTAGRKVLVAERAGRYYVYLA